MLFDIGHNEAFEKSGAVRPGQHWSAFDAPRSEARKGNATLFVTTIWNWHSEKDSSGKRRPTELAIVRTPNKSYWYRMEKAYKRQSRPTHVAHWEGLQLAISEGVPILGILKDVHTKRCASTVLFDIIGWRDENGKAGLWLNLSPRYKTEFPFREADLTSRISATNSSAHKPAGDFQSPEELEDPEKYIEGACRAVTVNAYERNRAARAACLKARGSVCVICGFDFAAEYGSELRGFIHVHHLVPVSARQERYELDPVKDLMPVCPNCHAVIHYGSKILTIEEVKELIRLARDA